MLVDVRKTKKQYNSFNEPLLQFFRLLSKVRNWFTFRFIVAAVPAILRPKSTERKTSTHVVFSRGANVEFFVREERFYARKQCSNRHGDRASLKRETSVSKFSEKFRVHEK